MRKRFFVVRKSVLYLLLLLCVLAFVQIVFAAPEGDCTYTIVGTTLTIKPSSGSSCTLGSNDNISSYYYPWTEEGVRGSFTKVVIEPGVHTAQAARHLFAGLENVTSWDLANLDVSGSTDLFRMFSNCSKLNDLSGLTNWDVSKVTDMEFMFQYCEGLTNLSGLDNWNVSNVTTMANMFQYCTGLTSLSALANWFPQNTVNKVTDMDCMFYGCEKLTNLNGLENWNVSSVINMEQMFSKCIGLTSLSALAQWFPQDKVNSVTVTSYMFKKCTQLTSLNGLENWNVSSVTEMESMFKECTGLTEVSALKDWNVSSVTEMESMFEECTGLKAADFSQWDFSKSGLSLSDMLNEVNGAAVKLNQYYTDMGGTNLYVFGKHSLSDLVAGSTDDSSALIFEPFSVAVSFTGGSGSIALSNVSSQLTSANAIAYYDAVSKLPDVTNTYDEGKYYFQSGGSCTLTFTPAEGILIQSVKLNGTDQGTGNILTLSNITENKTIEVILATTPMATATPFTLSYEMGDATGGTLPEIAQAIAGQPVTLPSNTGNLTCGSYPFIGWVDQNGTEYDEGQSFIMPAISLTFKPLFSKVQYTLSYDGGEAESGTVPDSQQVYYKVYTELAGNTGNLTKTNYTFKGWTDGTNEYAAGASYRMPKMNVTLKAVFEVNSYTLTYVMGDAESGDVPEAVTVPGGTLVTLAGNEGGLSKGGMEFSAWTDGIKRYQPGSDFLMPMANVTMRPVFSEGSQPEPKPLPEDEIGTYTLDETGMKVYIQFHNYDICMMYMNDENLCRNTSTNLYNN